MSDDIATMGELSDDSDSDDSDTESLASSVAELSSGMPNLILRMTILCMIGIHVSQTYMCLVLLYTWMALLESPANLTICILCIDPSFTV